MDNLATQSELTRNDVDEIAEKNDDAMQEDCLGETA